MSALGQTGASSHNHPGLSFPQVNGVNTVNGLRRGYPSSHAPTPPKPSPTPQHQSPYQPAQYPPQQPSQTAYPQHLFSSSTPSPIPNIASIPNIPNGNSRHAPPQAGQHVQVAPQAVRQHQHQQHPRGSQQRQMQPQPGPSSSMAYLQQAMNQPVQPVSQVPQAVPQPVQQIPHTQSMPQQIQPIQSQPVQQVQPPQPVQPNDSNLISPNPPHHQPHPQAHPQVHPQAHQQAHSQTHPQAHPQSHAQSHAQTHQQSHQQPHPTHPQSLPQIHQQQPPQLQPQPTPQPQNLPPAAPRPETHTTPPETQPHDDVDMDSPAESVEGDGHISPKLIEGTPFVPRTPMGIMMSAPPEGGSFPSLEAVHKHVLTYCTSVGYAVVIGRSKKTVPGLKKVLFVCDRAGKPPSRVSPEARKRKTSSRKCNCQFGFFAIEQRTQWTIRYRPDQTHLHHNHGPSESPLLHPAARKLDSEMVAAVKNLKESGIGVTQTLEILQQQNPHVPLLPRDIYNARAAINRNPQKVEAGIAEARPAIYSKPAPSAEERIRSDLRRELARSKEELSKLKEDTKKEIDELREKIREKDKIIEKFEMFIDICNQRVMVQRERLNDGENGGPGGPSN